MTTVIKLIAHAGGYVSGYEGQYLKSFDFDAHDGRGEADYSTNLAEALRFDDKISAMSFWKTQSRVRPMRPDGKPNRPLTAATIEIVPLDENGNAPSSSGLPVGVSPNGTSAFVCLHCGAGFFRPLMLREHLAENHL